MNKSVLDPAIVITGLGCVLPGCSDPEQFWQRLVRSETAIGDFGQGEIASALIPHFGAVGPAATAAAAVQVSGRLRRFASTCSLWGVQAVAAALAQAQLSPKLLPEDRCGLFTAQGDYLFPSVQSFSRGITQAAENQQLNLPSLTSEFIHQQGMDPFAAIKSLANNLLAVVSLSFGIRGDCGAFVQSETAVLAALQSALFSLRHGYSDVAVLVCSGSYAEALTLASLYQMEHLSACREGAASVRPFDLRRDGTIAGEGAVALVLETARHARRRGAVALAAVSGWAAISEQPDNRLRDDAYIQCVQKALDRGRLPFSDLDALVASGTGSHPLDRYEANLLLELHGGEPSKPITCVTPIIGSAPACPADWLAAILMLQHQMAPPIANLEEPLSPDLRFIYGRPVPLEAKHVAALSTGYTGFHSAVIFSNPEL